jgi:LPXTG-motif cell wall-anchored protein
MNSDRRSHGRSLCAAVTVSLIGVLGGLAIDAVGVVAMTAAAPVIYPIPAPELTTDKSTYPPDSKGTVTIDGFNGCPSVTIVIEGVPGSVTVVPDENGTVTFEVSMPGEPGEYTITGTCTVGQQTASSTITVREPDTDTVPTDPPATDPTPSTTAPGGRLPSTGSESGRPLLVGLVLLVSGAGFVVVTRSRRRAHR